MTIEEVISHCEKAGGDCECLQLKEWLEELKNRREAEKKMPSLNEIIKAGIMIETAHYSVGVPSELYHKGESVFGLCTPMENLIQINQDLGRGNVAKTLLHECLHAMLYERQMEKYNAGEHEVLIDEIAGGVIMLMRQNPLIVDLILNRGDKRGDEKCGAV